MHAIVLVAATLVPPQEVDGGVSPEVEYRVSLHELTLFPDRATCDGMLRLADAYIGVLKRREQLGGYAGQLAYLEREEAENLREAWKALREARFALDRSLDTAAEPQDFQQAQALSSQLRLLSLLGPGAYYAARMPPPVPLWRFSID